MTLAQWLATWAIASVLATPFVGHLLHERRVRKSKLHFRQVRQAVVVNRQKLETAVRSDLRDNADLERMRRAEALGFVDDDESGPFIEQKRKA